MTDETRINVERYLAGEMPPREAAIFLAEVQRDPEALAYLGKVLRQQALLFTLQRQEAGQQSGRNFAAGGVLPWTGGRLAWAAALFLVVSAAGWILWRQVAVPAVVAQVETVTGKVQVEQAGRTDKSTVTAGQALHAGERLLTTAADSTAVIVFPDGTRLQVEGQTELRLPQAGPAKRVWLEQGEIAATVVKQPGGQPMVLETALTETRVLGTRFHLTSKPGVTRLVVDEGLVQLTRKADGASIPLGAQQQSIARAENILVAHPLRVTSGLLALYPFDEGQGEVIHDRSGLGTPADIKLPEKTALRWVPGGVKFDGVGIGGGNLPAPVRARLENVSAVTLELWLQWDGDEWPLHYVFTRTANGQARFWENAISQGLVLQTPADSQAWTSMFLKWVQQYGEQRRARGFIIRLVAVYGRVLTPVEIRQNMDAGPA